MRYWLCLFCLCSSAMISAGESQMLKPLHIYGNGSLQSAAPFPDGKHFLTVAGTRAFIWNIETSRIEKILDAHLDVIMDAVVSSDGNTIWTLSKDKTVKQWDAKTGGLTASTTLQTSAMDLARLSPDGNRAAISSILESTIPDKVLVYEFDQASLADNGWAEIPGGFTGAKAGTINRIDFTGNPIPSSKDNQGLAIIVKPGEVAFLYAKQPVQTANGPVLFRLSVRADAPEAAVALAALKGNLVTMESVDGSIATHVPASAASFVAAERRLVLQYEPDSGKQVTPVIQVAATGKSGAVTVYVDRLEVFQLDAGFFGASVSTAAPSPTPTYAPTIIPTTNPDVPTPTNTPTVTPINPPVTPTPIPSLAVLSILPGSGAWGDTITISGYGFGVDKNLIQVSFNGLAGKVLDCTDQIIITDVPQGAKTGDLVVTVGSLSSAGVPFGVYTVELESAVIDPTTGGRVKTADGATAEFAAGSSNAPLSVQFAKSKDASGQKDGDREIVSDEYKLILSSDTSVETWATISLPLDSLLLPGDFDSTSDWGLLTPQYYDAQNRKWISFGAWMIYDPNKKAFTFFVPISLSTAGESASLSKFNSRVSPYLRTDEQVEVRVTRPPDTGMQEYSGLNSNFIVHYYPATVKSNTFWSFTGVGSGLPNQRDDVPDYVEDMDRALNLALEGLLQLRKSDGTPVFSDPTQGFFGKGKINVNVYDIGAEDGNSTLKGFAGGLINTFTWDTMLKIHETSSNNWAEMKAVAGHELVHYLQGQYYSLSGILAAQVGRNRWIIEAVANYYGMQAFDNNALQSFSVQQKYNFWIEAMGGAGGDYLSVPMWENSETNFYTLSHFLYWLENVRYPGAPIVSDMLNAGAGNTNDMYNLDRAIRQNDADQFGLSSAYEDYCHSVLTLQDGQETSFFVAAKSAMKLNVGVYLTPRQSQRIGFYDKNKNLWNTYVNLKKEIKRLSTAYLQLNTENTEEGLLVINPSKSFIDMNNREIAPYTYLPAGAGQQDYANDRNLREANWNLKNPLAFQPFGKNTALNSLEQLFVCPKISDWTKDWLLNPTTILDIDYYVLLEPDITSQQKGAVLWSTEKVGNIPPELIAGFDVYLMDSANSNKGFLLNSTPIPYSPNEQSYNDIFGRMEANSPLRIVIRDKAGYSWPLLNEDIFAGRWSGTLQEPNPSEYSWFKDPVPWTYFITFGSKSGELRFQASGSDEYATLIANYGEKTFSGVKEIYESDDDSTTQETTIISGVLQGGVLQVTINDHTVTTYPNGIYNKDMQLIYREEDNITLVFKGSKI